jgi:thiol:disulfide interchange protein DsbA
MTIRILSVLLAALVLAGTAGAKSFQEGVQYVPVQPQPPIGSGEQVEVVEFFWYGCPHCKEFEPSVKRWQAKLSDDVNFVQMPVLFGGAVDLHAQMFYALEAIGELDRLHEKLFHAMHVEKRKLRSRAEVEAFLAENGVDMAAFGEAMSSFAVAAKVNRARTLMRRYGVRSVPTMVVDGRYRSGTGFANYDEITEVVDHVVDKVRAQRKAQAQP